MGVLAWVALVATWSAAMQLRDRTAFCVNDAAHRVVYANFAEVLSLVARAHGAFVATWRAASHSHHRVAIRNPRRLCGACSRESPFYQLSRLAIAFLVGAML